MLPGLHSTEIGIKDRVLVPLVYLRAYISC